MNKQKALQNKEKQIKTKKNKENKGEPLRSVEGHGIGGATEPSQLQTGAMAMAMA